MYMDCRVLKEINAFRPEGLANRPSKSDIDSLGVTSICLAEKTLDFNPLIKSSFAYGDLVRFLKEIHTFFFILITKILSCKRVSVEVAFRFKSYVLVQTFCRPTKISTNIEKEGNKPHEFQSECS